MWNIKNYRFAFDPLGAALFLGIMLPNFVWFSFPAPNDVLRMESVTPLLDSIAQVLQIAIAAALCAMVNTAQSRPIKRGFASGAALCVVLYFAGWVAYYAGIANTAVVLTLCLTPCGAFLLFSLVRNNILALVSASVFTACHLTFAIVNFIL